MKFSSLRYQGIDHYIRHALTQVLPEDRVIPPLVIEPCGVSDESGSHDGETGQCELCVGRHSRGIWIDVRVSGNLSLGGVYGAIALTTTADDAWKTTMPTKSRHEIARTGAEKVRLNPLQAPFPIPLFSSFSSLRYSSLLSACLCQ
jgi:hypothetical protein